MVTDVPTNKTDGNTIIPMSTPLSSRRSLGNDSLKDEYYTNVYLQMLSSRCGYNLNDETSISCSTAFWIVQTLAIILTVVGTIGNILSIKVLRRPRFRKHSSSLYFLCIAFVDLFALWLSFGSIYGKRVSHLHRNQLLAWACLVWKFIFSLTHACSTWLLALLSVTRAILARYPLYGKVHLTRAKARFSIVLAFVTAGSTLACVLIVEQTLAWQTYGECKCLPVDNWIASLLIFLWILVYAEALPFIFLIGSNCIIIQSLCLKGRDVQFQSAREKARSINIILVTMSVYLVASYLPYQAYQIQLFHSETDTALSEQTLDKYAFVDDVLYLFAMSNYCLNFIFYFTNGSVFREELGKMMISCQKKIPNIFKTRSPETAARNMREGDFVASVQSANGTEMDFLSHSSAGENQ